MTIRFIKDIGLDLFTHDGEPTEKTFLKWDEIAVKELIVIDSYHYDIILPNDDTLCAVKKECFQVLDK